MGLSGRAKAGSWAFTSTRVTKVATACAGMAAMYTSLGRSREAAHYHAKADREHEAFGRDNEHAVRDLKAFWRTIAADHPHPTS